MKSAKKIVLITCYFGKFPWYFNLFLKSCKQNPNVNFLIFSDCHIPKDIPDNVNIISFTIKEFNTLATEKIGFNINIKQAYKLCDFKPAYGIIFSEYITNYDFWGMTDIDIVFGGIREFMTDELLNTYDVISVRNDYPTGSFMLFKNCFQMNSLFKKSKDYKKVFTSELHYCFDECNFKHNFLQEGGDIFDIDCEIESMHHVIKKEEKENGLKAHFDFLIVEGLPGQLKWENGFLSYKNEFEALLHHLILYKANKYTRKKTLKDVPDTFYIDKYLVRKNELSSVKGFSENLYYNKIRPSIKKKLFKLEYLIANKFNIEAKGLSNYTYKLNDRSIKISKNCENKNSISTDNSEYEMRLVKSLFKKDVFFIKSFPNVKYRIKKDDQKLMELFLNGNNQSYK